MQTMYTDRVSLARACARQLIWAQPLISLEIASWHARALQIQDDSLRKHALDALREKRNLALGAGFFCILAKRRSVALVRLLVSYQIMWDFLDSVSEDVVCAADAASHQLHLALVEGLTPGAPRSDYYSLCEAHDGGYLSALVAACQSECSRLPSYPQVMPLVLEGVVLCSVQALNHQHEPHRRELALRQWAAVEFPDDHTTPWFELTAAASAFMPHALLALGSEAACVEQDVVPICAGYFPWMSLAIVMLDSYVDRAGDLTRGAHSYIAYYGDEHAATGRLIEIIRKLLDEMQLLDDGGRHAVLASCMVAMYLASDDAHAPQARDATREIIRQCDPLTRLLVPVLRLFRTFRGGAEQATGLSAAGIGGRLWPESDGRC